MRGAGLSPLWGGGDPAGGPVRPPAARRGGFARLRIEGVATTPQGAMNFSVAADGTLIYVTRRAGRGRGGPWFWVDRRGGEATGTPARAYLHPRLFSPDGTKVAVDLEDQDQDIWIWDLERRTDRFTFNSGVDIHPTWTPDGNRL